MIGIRPAKRDTFTIHVSLFTFHLRGIIMDIQVGDILTMKKAHPCGSKQWQVLRTGADFRLKCLGCGHEVLLPRSKAEKNIREIRREK
jgi:hypothetical protein